MIWYVCFFAAVGIAAVTVLAAVLSAVSNRKDGRLLPPIQVLFAGIFLSVAVSFLPIYTEIVGDSSCRVLKVLVYSVHNTIQVFTINVSCTFILDTLSSRAGVIYSAYSVYMTVAFITAPVLTFGFVISFFNDFTANLRCLLFRSQTMYVFSGLEERSLALAEDLARTKEKHIIAFADAGDGVSQELLTGAHAIDAVCLRKDILSLRFGYRNRNAKLVFFLISDDEQKNLTGALGLAGQYGDWEHAEMYVVSTETEGELLLMEASQKQMRVRRINPVRSLISHTLYEEGHRLFENVRLQPDGEKLISAVIVGMDRYGTEMVKALSWYCQMDGYRVEIDAFDSDPLSEERFGAACPELLSDRLNGRKIPGEAEYTIRIHPGIDVQTKQFNDMIRQLPAVTYVFVSLGSDEANIRMAAEMRMLTARYGSDPQIVAVVGHSERKEALKDIRNYRGQPYRLEFIGDERSFWSEKVIISSELEAEALKGHLKWGEEAEFWRYEYNYRSSVASAIHRRARIACKMPGAGKDTEELTLKERDLLEDLEHRRWNAYMRSEGYVYSGSTDKASRNDLAKVHHDLVPFQALTEEEKRKDSSVGATC